MGMARASLVAMVLAGALAAGGCSSALPCPSGASCPSMAPFKVTFTVTVNGRPPSPSRILPRFSVRPAQLLAINVVVTVPGRARFSALWVGISAGGPLGSGPNGPTGVHPGLLHSSQVLTAGRHSFRLRGASRRGRDPEPVCISPLSGPAASRPPSTRQGCSPISPGADFLSSLTTSGRKGPGRRRGAGSSGPRPGGGPRPGRRARPAR
jgi:hypothetical protein